MQMLSIIFGLLKVISYHEKYDQLDFIIVTYAIDLY